MKQAGVEIGLRKGPLFSVIGQDSTQAHSLNLVLYRNSYEGDADGLTAAEGIKASPHLG